MGERPKNNIEEELKTIEKKEVTPEMGQAIKKMIEEALASGSSETEIEGVRIKAEKIDKEKE